MVYKYLAEYTKDRKSFQSSISNECWKCHSKNIEKIDSGEVVSKCRECGSTTKYYTYKVWLSNIKTSSKYTIKSAKEAINDLKNDKLRKEKEYKKNVAEQKERIQRARDKIKSMK